MPTQTFSLYTTVHYFEDNEWLANEIVKKVRKLWSKSNNTLEDANFKKAISTLKPYFSATFDRERIVDKISDLIAPVDEDGWRNANEMSLLYGLRKSIFSPIDIDSYERDKVDFLDLINIQFYKLNDDDELDQNIISNALTVTITVTVKLPVKRILSMPELEIWLEKFDLDLADSFKVDLSDSLTTCIDEDGDEFSSTGSATLDEGVLMAESETSAAELRESARHIAMNGDLEVIEISDSSVDIFNKLKVGDIPNLLKCLQNKNIDSPLVDGIETSAILPMMFTSLLENRKELEDAINGLNPELEFKFPKKAIVIEIIYALASMGANLKYRIGGAIGYLEIAIMTSDELTEFLLSFGLDSLGESADALLIAAELGRVDLVKRFISDSANVNHATEEGTTAILLAAQGIGSDETLSQEAASPFLEIVNLLCAAGADIKTIDNGGDGVLSNAARVNSKVMCDHVIKLGADINPHLTNDKAFSPAKIAKQKNKDLYAYLISLGAKVEQATKAKTSASSDTPLNLKKEKTLSEKDQRELLDTLKSSTKIECLDCKKMFTVATLKKWEGRCSKCFKANGGELKPKRKVIAPKKAAVKKKIEAQPEKPFQKKFSVGDFFNDVFELLGALFELIKALAVLGFALSIIILIITVLFTG
jgi:ankyrin repeat protein